MNASSPLTADRSVVRAFVARIHALADAATAGLHEPGLMQLVVIHPAGGDGGTLIFQFKIGEVDFMTDEAVRQSNTGYNVYIETRTSRRRAPRDRRRGTIADTVAVFALVIDDDADKGRGGRTTERPSLVIESSPGNTHRWFVLASAIPAERAARIGQGIKGRTNGDSDTGVVSQPFRVAGTPNFPGKAKAARGRVATQTGILDLDGPIWTADELEAAFPPPKPRAKAQPNASAEGETGPTGRTSFTAELIAAETGAPDRSERFFASVAAAFADGLSPDDLEAILRRHPEGCAGKYLEPYDRLHDEIDRAWKKVAAKAEDMRRAAEKPTYADASSPIDQARDQVAAAVLRFITTAVEHNLTKDKEADPPVHAVNITTGVGKTRGTAKGVAEHVIVQRGSREKRKAILYAVPTHRLGDEIERQFAEYGVTARVFRGRQAEDPAQPGQTMCHDLEAIETALALGAVPEKACCRMKTEDGQVFTCPHFHACGYQAQKEGQPDVWIVAHQMLFHAQPAFGKVQMVIVDEGFWQSGLRIPRRGLTLDELRTHIPMGSRRDDYLHNDIETFRARLANGLAEHEKWSGTGGVRREHLLRSGLTGDTCTQAIEAEWKLKETDKVAIYPGMPKTERIKAAQAAHHAKYVRAYLSIWKAARELLHDTEAETSGRLYLDHREDEDGRVTIVKARSLKKITTGWQVPTLILDATLPAPEILRAFYPQVEIPAPIEAAMPHARVRQVMAAPVASRKLKADDDGANRNLRAIRREILRRFVELGRKPILAVAQKAAADWLRGSDLPEGVSVEHFNAVAGLDRYRDVRGLMVIGRTVPPPVAVEALAGAITGREPQLVGRGEWYGKAVRGIRTDTAGGSAVECDAHPDPVAEACRWQICEGELLQAIGRARGVNRTAETPLAIDIIANVCLPLTINEVAQWCPPGEEFEMLADGVILDSGADMSVAWPNVWPTPDAARKWLSRRAEAAGHTVTDPYKKEDYIGFRHGVRFRYQREGRNQKWRAGVYDPAAVMDLRAWLESRLGGSLAGLVVETAAQHDPASPHSRAGARRPVAPLADRHTPRPRPGFMPHGPHFRAPLAPAASALF